jgi:hypothetical protein
MFKASTSNQKGLASGMPGKLASGEAPSHSTRFPGKRKQYWFSIGHGSVDSR